MNLEKVAYRGWDNCYRVANERVELIATTDVGPRIIRFGFVGAENEFHEFDDQVGKTGGEAWRPYGGHRLWHAPEAAPRSYLPDNFPVEVQVQNYGIHLIQPVEVLSGIQKEMEISLDEAGAKVNVLHRLCNHGLWPVELAPWCQTDMAQNGVGIIPLPPRGPHPENLLPINSLSMWAYTELSDPLLVLGTQFILLGQDPTRPSPQKIGAYTLNGWTAYARAGHLFVKRYTFQPGVRYPDMNANVQIYTDGDILELETLAPLVILEPGEDVEHVEEWYLFDHIPQPAGEKDVIEHVLPTVLSIP